MNTTQSEMIQWYYEENGQKKGPVSGDAIAQLIRASTIAPATAAGIVGIATIGGIRGIRG